MSTSNDVLLKALERSAHLGELQDFLLSQSEREIVALAEEIKRLRQALAVQAEEADSWRALRNCARITAVGCAGIHTVTPDHYAHITLNFWTHHPEAGEAIGRIWLEKFVAVARAAEADRLLSGEHPVPEVKGPCSCGESDPKRMGPVMS